MPSSPLQRVLVNKTTNATFSPSKQQSAGLVAGGKENLVSKLISDWADIHSAVVAGCKRSIDQMDSDRESPTAKRPTIEFQIYSKDGINRTDAVRKVSFLPALLMSVGSYLLIQLSFPAAVRMGCETGS
jgi:hypothetical protein